MKFSQLPTEPGLGGGAGSSEWKELQDEKRLPRGCPGTDWLWHPDGSSGAQGIEAEALHLEHIEAVGSIAFDEIVSELKGLVNAASPD